MIKAVILDFDDTLVLTEEICFNLENEILNEMGMPKMDRKIHLKTWGHQLSDVISERSEGVDVEEFFRIYPKVLKRYTSSGLLDAVPEENFEMLRQLEKEGRHLAILTNRNYEELKHILTKEHLLNGLVKYFYHRDNSIYHKPDPRAFDDIIIKNKLKPEECVYVGDSPNDAKAALGAKINFIASLESGLRKKSEFDELGVDYFISKFTELTDAVKKIEKIIYKEVK